MKRSNSSKIITANDLKLGHVVYLGDNGWVTDIERARTFATKEEAESILTKFDDPNPIVGAYIVDRPDGPLHIREAIRADGPTISYSAE